jgi:hypothetical protein
LFKTFQEKTQENEKPEFTNSHWRKRIGFLMPVKKDYWWTIDDATSIDMIIQETSFLLHNLVVPEIEKYLKDEDLIEEWLKGISEGVTELQRYLFLTMLLRLNGDKRLPKVVEELVSFSRGRAYESTVNEHMKRLDLYDK